MLFHKFITKTNIQIQKFCQMAEWMNITVSIVEKLPFKLYVYELPMLRVPYVP